MSLLSGAAVAQAPLAARSPDGLAYRAQPLTTEIYFADPSAHVFDGRVYVYGSHDVEGPQADDQPGKGFVMNDYRVLSMASIGGPVVVHPAAFALADVPWANRQLWAPDVARRHGRYFFYFPAKDAAGVFRLGVATGDRAEGPFKPEPEPIPGAYSIDPSVFIDDDDQAYLYFGGIHGGQLQRWASGQYEPQAGDTDLKQPDAPALSPKVARLSADMLTLAEPARDAVIVDEAGKPLVGGDLDRRFFEAAWMHKRNGLYYLSYSTGETHYIAYATATSPTGPFTYRGHVLLPVQGWTTHHSIVEVEGRWRLFYHDTQASSRTHLRSAKVVDLTHNPDGTIQLIDPFIRQP
ncbi:glycoside hydrolase family 43 protein [Brevundimonas sp. PAMC22021]|uniref:glycoside hydrolase family 43 protein n=1 Tax=Brevundimonas sp. PAMC22021 TaxID=2861285 RepID=UPI001C639EA1|nr:glycoside hydrolase family 43 protein [Brevundimonas sp. PAMC22021]QYF87103.1 glycoside hydrolase family 43 protein [Brevundimonas sp. PAMC22021]